MAYEHIVLAANDQDLLHRVTAAVAAEDYVGDPFTWAQEHRWEIAVQFGDEFASAVDVVHVDRPGLRASVISDQAILSAVQALLAP
jgi:hypothetical protein